MIGFASFVGFYSAMSIVVKRVIEHWRDSREKQVDDFADWHVVYPDGRIVYKTNKRVKQRARASGENHFTFGKN